MYSTLFLNLRNGNNRRARDLINPMTNQFFMDFFTFQHYQHVDLDKSIQFF